MKNKYLEMYLHDEHIKLHKELYEDIKKTTQDINGLVGEITGHIQYISAGIYTPARCPI